MKYARVSAVVRWSGGTTVLGAGSTTADDDHPLVLERPDLWTDQAPAPHLAGPSRVRGEAPVETATRAPSERRGPVKRA
jgi:hypothetical protein